MPRFQITHEEYEAVKALDKEDKRQEHQQKAAGNHAPL